MDFANIYAQGFARVAARCLPIKLADPGANAAAVIEDVKALSADGVCLAVYPELNLTGYTCGDLFLQDALLDAVEDAIGAIVEESKEMLPIIVVGAPLRWNGRVYNCAAVIQGGQLRAVVPKTYLPNHAGFAERRWFASGADISVNTWIHLGAGPWTGMSASFAPQQIVRLVEVPGLNVGIELCEDMWVPIPPSAQMALNGATVLVNLASPPAGVGKADARRLMARSESARCNAAYVFVAAGWGESTTDASWDAHAMVYECGDLLGQSERFAQGATGTTVDVDLRRIVNARRRQGSQDDNRAAILTSGDRCVPNEVWIYLNDDSPRPLRIGDGVPSEPAESALALPTGDIGLRRPLSRFPLVPDDPAGLDDVYRIQTTALARRLSAVGEKTKAVIGVSGGLDSTWALIVAAGAMDLLGRPHTDILGFTMPGFATSAGTKSNAWALMKAIGVTAEEIDIRPAATQMLKDLGHSAEEFDVTFENVQAGLRADYLFRAANQRGGLVVGTGDLSEAALGWCTYGVGDHMSHYDVNAGVPKTLLQHLIPWAVEHGICPDAKPVLNAILHQEISPELVPAKDGRTLQSTEQMVGPYALNDAFLHYMMQGMSPSRIAYLVWQTWKDTKAGVWPDGSPDEHKVTYDLATVKTWLAKFYRRFFASQFKRSCSPDGPQVLPISLSPRDGWKMPSDETPDVWLAELDANVPDHHPSS